MPTIIDDEQENSDTTDVVLLEVYEDNPNVDENPSKCCVHNYISKRTLQYFKSGYMYYIHNILFIQCRYHNPIKQ